MDRLTDSLRLHAPVRSEPVLSPVERRSDSEVEERSGQALTECGNKPHHVCYSELVLLVLSEAKEPSEESPCCHPRPDRGSRVFLNEEKNTGFPRARE